MMAALKRDSDDGRRPGGEPEDVAFKGSIALSPRDAMEGVFLPVGRRWYFFWIRVLACSVVQTFGR